MNLAKSIGILVALALSRTSEARPDAAAPTVPDRNDQSLMILKATRTGEHPESRRTLCLRPVVSLPD